MSETALRLPPAIQYGFVDCQIILAVADSGDEDRKPDAHPATGTVTLTPLDPKTLESDPKPLIVFRRPISGTLDTHGRLRDGQGQRGIWVPVGRYRVSYALSEIALDAHDVTVNSAHTEEDPLHLPTLSGASSMPPLTPSQYQDLLDRINLIEGVDSGSFVIGWDDVTNKPTYFNSDWTMITNKPERFDPVIGNTSDTAKAGDYTPSWGEITGKPSTFPPTIGTTEGTAKDGSYVPAWTDITGKPSTFAPTIGTSATQAKAGNYTPDWGEITNKPAAFATTWTTVTGKPTTFAPVVGTTSTTAKAGNWFPKWSEVTEKPTNFATDWSTVANKPSTFPPTIGTTSTTAKAGDYAPSWDEVTNKPTSFPTGWGSVSGKPTTFPPTIGTTSTTAKAGDYTPAWSDVTGKPSTFTPATHTHTIANVSGLQASLDGKASGSHSHSGSDLSGVVKTVNGVVPDGNGSVVIDTGLASVAWEDVSGKPNTFPPVIGTTASTAKAGNYTPTWAEVSGKPSTFAPTIGTTATTAKAGNYTPTWDEVGNKPSTYPPAIGTTASTAKAGNYVPTWPEITGKPTVFATDWGSIADKPSTFPPTIGTTAATAAAGNHSHTWAQVTGKPTTFAPIIGTTATTAKAGNYVPSWGQVTGKPSAFPSEPHAASHAKAGSDAITPESIGAPSAEQLESLRTNVGQSRRLTPFHLALASQDSAPCNVYVMGDSVSEGACSNTAADRWQSVFERTMRDRPGGSGYLSAWTISPFVQKTGRFSSTPQPVAAPNNPPVIYDTGMTSAGLSAKRIGVQKNGWAEWDFEGDRVRLWYSRTTFFGLSARIYIDGQFITELNGGSVNESSEWWTSGLLSPGLHTIRIQEKDNVNGAFWIEGTEGFYDDASTGVHVYDGARSGARVEDYTSNDHIWPTSMAKIAPALVMMWFGYNDMNQRTPAQFKADMTTTVNRIKSTLTEGTYTLAIVAGWAPAPPPTAGWEAYVQVMEEVAASHPYGVCIRLIDRWPVMTAGVDNPGMFGNDTIHPGNSGQRLIGSHFAETLSLPDNTGVFKKHIHSIDSIEGLEATLQDKANISSVQDTGWVPIPLNADWSGQARVRRNGNLVQFHVTDLNGSAVGSSLATLAVIPEGFRAPAGFTAHGVGATSSSTAVGAVAMTVTSSGGGSGMSENVRVSTPSSWNSGAGSVWWHTDEPWPTQSLLASLRGSGEQGGSITHAQIVARSARWFPPTGPAQVPYSRVDEFPDNDGHSYRADCSGFVSMCLHADRSYSTRSIDQISIPITKAQLKPGDYLNSYDNHVVLFLGWTDGTQTRYNARESSGPKGGTIEREIPYPYFEGSSPETYVPMKYINVSD